jgi:DNA repair protein RadB
MCGDDFDAVIPNILFYEPFSFEEQEAQLDEAIRVASSAKDINLVILDSATVFFRLKQGEEDQGRSSLTYQIIRLLTLARKSDIAVVITSQVYFDIEHKVIKPLGGHTLHHNAKAILFLEKLEPGRRRMTIIKHRSIVEGKSSEFLLTSKGVE